MIKTTYKTADHSLTTWY